ncbi:MAG: DsbA family protein [Gammaproteobacteria bacterium]|nr:DsbA family protein [Gammaproteobacteria bacterium]MCW8988813.1 DsbA family protein [Gammaproteobacteria bacterium]
MMDNNDKPILWYFADPMCSWCWGFSPVISEIKKNYASKVNIALVMGGLQAGKTVPLSASSRDEIFHHWHQVEEMAGQVFSFENALPDGFIYNTEPACRAVITVGSIDATKTFSYFTAIQSAFYTKNQDVTDLDVLQRLAAECGINAEEFNYLFHGEKQRTNVKKNFEFTKKAGVQGFPTLILNKPGQLDVITRGYDKYENVATALDKLLFA